MIIERNGSCRISIETYAQVSTSGITINMHSVCDLGGEGPTELTAWPAGLLPGHAVGGCGRRVCYPDTQSVAAAGGSVTRTHSRWLRPAGLLPGHTVGG